MKIVNEIREESDDSPLRDSRKIERKEIILSEDNISNDKKSAKVFKINKLKSENAS